MFLVRLILSLGLFIMVAQAQLSENILENARSAWVQHDYLNARNLSYQYLQLCAYAEKINAADYEEAWEIFDRAEQKVERASVSLGTSTIVQKAGPRRSARRRFKPLSSPSVERAGERDAYVKHILKEARRAKAQGQYEMALKLYKTAKRIDPQAQKYQREIEELESQMN